MKKYNELERQVIIRILYYHENSLYNVIGNIFFDINGIFGVDPRFYFNFIGPDAPTMEIHSNFANQQLNQSQHDFNAFINNIITKVSQTMNLLHYLEENDYLITQSDMTNISRLGTPIEGDEYITFNNLDPQFRENLFEFRNLIFFPLDKLIELKENDFKDEDTIQKEIDLEHRLSTRRLSEAAIIISISSAIISGFFSFLQISGTSNINLTNKKLEIEMDNERIIEEISELQKEARETNLYLKKFLSLLKMQ